MSEFSPVSLAYDQGEEHVLRRLGCAVAVLWSSFPEDTQRRLDGQAAAVADREEVLRPRLAIEAFLRDHAS